MRKIHEEKTVPVTVDVTTHAIKFGFVGDAEKIAFVQVELNGKLPTGERVIQMRSGDAGFDTVIGNVDLAGVMDRLLSFALPEATVEVLEEKPKEEKYKLK